MDIKEAVQQQFGAVAARYAASAVHRGGPDLDALLVEAAPRGDENVLDVGCGTGHAALALAERVRSVVAVDLTEEMLEQGRRLARERGRDNVTFERGDVEHLRYSDAVFDLVTSRYSAHHYAHPQRALDEIARVLKPQGVFLLVDVIAPPDPAQDTFLNAVELLRDPSHVRDHSIEQWLRMLDRAGLDGHVVQTWMMRMEFASWIARMQTPTEAAARIRRLLDGAPRDIRDAFAIEADGSFSIPVALFRATKRAGA